MGAWETTSETTYSIAGTVCRYAEVLKRPSFWELRPVVTRVPKSTFPGFARVGPSGAAAAATTVASSHSAAYARNATPSPTPQPASIYYVNQPHADLITHAHAPVMNLLFTDTTYSIGPVPLFSISLLVLLCWRH